MARATALASNFNAGSNLGRCPCTANARAAISFGLPSTMTCILPHLLPPRPFRGGLSTCILPHLPPTPNPGRPPVGSVRTARRWCSPAPRPAEEVLNWEDFACLIPTGIQYSAEPLPKSQDLSVSFRAFCADILTPLESPPCISHIGILSHTSPLVNPYLR